MDDYLDTLIRMRFIVGALGEKTVQAWWNCDFLSPDGQEMLMHNFPRSPQVAGFTATSLAAKLVHDDRIGRTGVHHLFRLEPDLETMLAKRVAAGGPQLFGSMPKSAQELLGMLGHIALEEIDSPPGPVQVGHRGGASTGGGIQQMAAHYQAAFRGRTQIFPYFAATR